MKANLNKNIVLHTDLSVDECKERLMNSIDTRPRWISKRLNPIPMLLGNEQQQVRGNIIENEFEVEKRRYHNTVYTPIFQGSITKENTFSGTCIEGKFNIPSFSVLSGYLVKIFLGILCLIALFGITQDIVSNNKSNNNYAALAVIALFFIVFMAFDILNKLLAKNEEKFLLEFLEKTLEARTEYQNDQDVRAK